MLYIILYYNLLN